MKERGAVKDWKGECGTLIPIVIPKRPFKAPFMGMSVSCERHIALCNKRERMVWMSTSLDSAVKEKRG
jgi:hypothetical protein